MAYELFVTSTPEPAGVSTDEKYLRQHFTSYDNGHLGIWPVEKVRAHRDGHEAGHVWRGKRLARVFRRDSNVVAALGQRVAPWLGCAPELSDGDDGLRAELAPQLSPRGHLLPLAVLRDVAEDLAMCGMAVLHHPWTPRPDGSRWDTRARTWDLESVEWDAYHDCYYAQTREMGRVPIVHGDGVWTIVKANDLHPHEHGAVIPLAINVASRMSTIVDRNNGSRAVGMPKVVGTLPESVKVASPEGLSLDTALNTMMQGLTRIVVPNGTTVTKLQFDAAGMGQFFGETIKFDRTDVFFALTGQDGSAQSAGGNYQKAAVLEAVLYSWVVADVMAGSSGISSGLLRPYAAINRGDPELAPWLGWPLPDPDEDARIKSRTEREAKLVEIVGARKKEGFAVTQQDVNTLAAALRIPPPTLADVGTKKELFAYHQHGGLFTRNEIRESRGYPALLGTGGDELVDETAQTDTQQGQG